MCWAAPPGWAGAVPKIPLGPQIPRASVSPSRFGSPQLTWQTRQTVTVLDVVQEPTGGESHAASRTGCCWGVGLPPDAGGPHPSSPVPCPARSLHRDLRHGAAAAVLGSRQPASPAGHPAAQPHGELGDRDRAGLQHGPCGDLGSCALSPRRTCCWWTRRQPLSPTSLPVRCAWLLVARWQVRVSPGSHRGAAVCRVTRRVLGAAHHPVGPAGGHLLGPTPPTPPGEQRRGTAPCAVPVTPCRGKGVPRCHSAPVPRSWQSCHRWVRSCPCAG